MHSASIHGRRDVSYGSLLLFLRPAVPSSSGSLAKFTAMRRACS
jgi:hypothetical protein